ncbi:hypothetical protein J6590_041553 [Homalodisca vitripennis]|nr:hypothetical protein J6590_041553 [Homalodisca vitripennis]
MKGTDCTCAEGHIIAFRGEAEASNERQARPSALGGHLVNHSLRRLKGDRRLCGRAFTVLCTLIRPRLRTRATSYGDFRTTTNGRAGGLLARTGSFSANSSKQQPRSTLLDLSYIHNSYLTIASPPQQSGFTLISIRVAGICQTPSRPRKRHSAEHPIHGIVVIECPEYSTNDRFAAGFGRYGVYSLFPGDVYAAPRYPAPAAAAPGPAPAQYHGLLPPPHKECVFSAYTAGPGSPYSAPVVERGISQLQELMAKGMEKKRLLEPAPAPERRPKRRSWETAPEVKQEGGSRSSCACRAKTPTGESIIRITREEIRGKRAKQRLAFKPALITWRNVALNMITRTSAA